MNEYEIYLSNATVQIKAELYTDVPNAYHTDTGRITGYSTIRFHINGNVIAEFSKKYVQGIVKLN